MQRLRELIDLLAASWRIWRASGEPADLEIHAYETSWEARAENVIFILPRSEPDRNAVHFSDRRRRMH
jgi:hypothetical protein